MFLEVKNLSKKFDKKEVVKNLSFSLGEGKLLCLLGASGCGKTTTLNLLGGFCDCDSGSIILDGHDITCIPPEKRSICTVFQSYGLFPHMSVFENITYGLKLRHLPKGELEKKGNEYLALVRLEEYKNAKISEISGGQQQRVAIARSLAVEPKICLFDEPFCNLDAELRTAMRKELKDIQKKLNMTMVFVTHDQEEALSIADYIAVMDNGALVKVYSINEIISGNVDDVSAKFLHLNEFVWKDDILYKKILL